MSRALILSAATLVVAASSCRVGPSVAPASSSGSLQALRPLTVNPQGPGYLDWSNTEGDGVYFQGNIASLPSAPDASTTITSQDGGSYTLWVAELDPCVPYPAALGGAPIPLRLYVVNDAQKRNVCAKTVYTTARPGACEQDAGPALREKAVVVPGRWDVVTGAFTSCDGGADCFTVSCLTGAVGMCAHWGYVPTYRWPDGGVDLQRHHRACVRAARADYGNGEGFTCPGTYIDVIDGPGIQVQAPPDVGVPLEFEAAWNEDGAVPFGVPSPGRPGSCIRPRYENCNKGINQALGQPPPPGKPPFQADNNCTVPPPSYPNLRSYFDGGVPFVLLTRTWQNQSCGGHCVRGKPDACPRAHGYGPFSCRDGGGF